MKIYLVCRPCDDSYYAGHPTDKAYATKEEAQAECDKHNPDHSDPHYHDWAYYVHEVDLFGVEEVE